MIIWMLPCTSEVTCKEYLSFTFSIVTRLQANTENIVMENLDTTVQTWKSSSEGLGLDKNTPVGT